MVRERSSGPRFLGIRERLWDFSFSSLAGEALVRYKRYGPRGADGIWPMVKERMDRGESMVRRDYRSRSTEPHGYAFE